MALTKATNRMTSGAPANVLDFGAVGDGVADDTLAIQAALDAGGSIYIPTGTYSVTGLNVVSNTKMFGDGNSTVLLADGNTSILSATTKTNFMVSDMLFKRTNGVTGSPSNTLFPISDCTFCLVDNITIDGTSSTAPGDLTLAGVRNSTINNCNFINAAGFSMTSVGALLAGTWSSNNVISGCVMTGGWRQGFDVYYARDCTFDNCVSYGGTYTYSCGFVIEFECENIVMNNCIAYDNVRAGIYLEGNVAYGVRNITLSNCTSYNNGEAGLTLDANFDKVTVVGGTYRDNTAVFGNGNGIQAASNLGLTVTGALITGNAGHGISWSGTPYMGTFSGNIFKSNGGYAIYLAGTPTIIDIGENMFNANTSGEVFGWVEAAGNNISAAWTTYVPTFYENDGTTVITIASSSIKFKKIGKTVTIVGKFTCASGALTTGTYMTVPINVAWTGGGTADDASSGRGVKTGNVSGIGMVNSIYYTNRLQFSSSTTDTNIVITATYEIA
jgi:hypothetical protein